ncbi:MAG TPA: thiamine-phosphate kinase [Terracidiphilus sp.]|jgi:thiamine-monophosphate kinase
MPRTIKRRTRQSTPARPAPASVAELALIERIRLRAAHIPTPELRLGIGDDCALLRLAPDEELAVTTDLSIAGRHFRLDWHPPESVGHRALARGLSDLAAMGARPVAAFLSLALPPDLVQNVKRREAAPSSAARRSAPAPFIDRFLDGFLSLAAANNVPLAGGDLAQSTLALADVVLTGAVARGQALLRSGARPGDLVYVTGSLGGGAAGLAYLAQLGAAFKRSSQRERLKAMGRNSPKVKATLNPHLYPTPRIAQGLWLARNAIATAAIDLSDGLSNDLTHICAESGVAAELFADALPIAPGASPSQVLHGGEDYELLFTASPSARVPSNIEGVAVTRIGRIVAKGAANKVIVRKSARPSAAPPVILITPKGRVPLVPQGWQHFS